MLLLCYNIALWNNAYMERIYVQLQWKHENIIVLVLQMWSVCTFENSAKANFKNCNGHKEPTKNGLKVREKKWT